MELITTDLEDGIRKIDLNGRLDIEGRLGRSSDAVRITVIDSGDMQPSDASASR